AASELLYPLLPIFLTGVLAAPPVVVGVIEGLADATAGIVRYFAGKWSDTRGRKPFIGAGYGIAVLGKGLVAGAVVWPMVLFGRMTDRFGKGVRSAPRDALIAATTEPKDLGRAFGFHRMGDSLGAVIGPLLGLLALSVMQGNVRAAMWWALIPASLSAALTILIREPKLKHVTQHQQAPVATSHHLSRSFWRVATVLSVISLVNFSDALLLVRVLDLGFSTTEVVLAYVLFNSVYTIGSYPAGIVSDRIPRHIVYAIGLAFFAIGYLGLGLVDQGPWVYVVVAAYGVFPALTDGVGKAWIASTVSRDQLGRAQGVFQALTTGGILIAGLWAGLLWRIGPGNGVVPLLIAGSIAGIASLLLGFNVVRITPASSRA
ncbi:MAG: hypothetical protein RIR69_1519, partial [Actinomycetota bacterium]